jgi:hypothetical protein
MPATSILLRMHEEFEDITDAFQWYPARTLAAASFASNHMIHIHSTAVEIINLGYRTEPSTSKKASCRC